MRAHNTRALRTRSRTLHTGPSARLVTTKMYTPYYPVTTRIPASHPTTTSGRPSTSLPGRRVRLVGRERDLEAAVQLIQEGPTRLVTLTGAGGTGKTSLALEAAHAVRDGFPGGTWYVPLEAATPDTDLAAFCAANLGLVEEAASNPTTRLRSFVNTAPALLVLDNCEHIATSVATLIDDVLTGCPEARILTTSRSPLKLRDEAVFLVNPLELPPAAAQPSPGDLAAIPAIALFIERARAARQTFRLTRENAPAVIDVCRRVGGIPLAIELAAARSAAFTPAELAHRLDSAQTLSERGSTRPARHQSLRAAIDWSYNLLNDREKQLFRRFGALAGRWTLESAEDISLRIDGDSSDVAAVLPRLVEASLIVFDDDDDTGRYGTLVPVREYARDRLQAAGELEITFRAHAGHYQDVARDLARENARALTGSLLGRIDQELENLFAAMRWSIEDTDPETALRIVTATWFYWRIRGHMRTVLVYLDAALRDGAGVSPAVRTRALLLASDHHRLTGQLERAVEEAAEAYRAAVTLDSAETQSVALGALGDTYTLMGNLAAAREHYDPAIAIAEKAGRPRMVAWGLGSLAIVARREGDNEEATELLERARSLVDEHDGSSWTKGRTLAELARSVRRRSELHRARDLLRDAIGELQPIYARVELVECFEELAHVAAATRQPQHATLLLGASRAIRESIGSIIASDEQAALDASLEDLRQRPGIERFTAAWNRGRNLSFEETISAARSGETPGVEEESTSPLAILTPREREVAHLVAAGLTNAAIAQRLVISTGTARIHVERIRRKLGCRSRVEIANIVSAPPAS